MNTGHLSLIVLLFGSVLAADMRTDDYAPDFPAVERYQHLWKKNPFTPPAPEENLVRSDGIEQQYVLSGLVKMSDEWVAFVLDRKTLERVKVSTETSPEGLQLVSVQEQLNPKDSSIILRAGSQTGMIRYDQNLLNAQAMTSGEKQADAPQPSAASSSTPLTAQHSIPQEKSQTNSGSSKAPPSPARSVRRPPINLSR